MKREQKTKIFAVIVSIVLVILLISQIQIGDFFDTITTISPVYLLISFILYACCYLFRALRFRTLLNYKVGLKSLFSIICIHNMINRILPARTGELSYIFMVNKLHRVSIAEGVATLGIARLFDFITISIFFLSSSLLVKEIPQIMATALFTIAPFLFILIFFLVILINKSEELMGTLENIAIKLGLQKIKTISIIFEKFEDMVTSVGIIQSKRAILESFVFSVIIWSTQYLVFFFLVIGLGVELSVMHMVLGTTFAVLVMILPIPALGSFGTFEGAWAIAFVALGISKATAISIGFSVHIILFVYFLLLGSYGFLTLNTKQ